MATRVQTFQKQYGANNRSDKQAELSKRSPIYVPSTNTSSSTVSVDNAGNLVVMGDEATIDQIRQTVARLDTPSRQRLIESESEAKYKLDARIDREGINLSVTPEKKLVEVSDSGVNPVQRNKLVDTDPMSTMPSATPSAISQTDAPAPKPATPPPVPQPEIQTRDNAFSTFSLNVSDVSFKLAAASLEKGQMPDPASMRSEEFINAFDYRDPEPPPGAPIAFAWERARYPFAHNRDLLRFSVKTAARGPPAGPAAEPRPAARQFRFDGARRPRAASSARRCACWRRSCSRRTSSASSPSRARRGCGWTACPATRPAKSPKQVERSHAAGRHESRRRDEPRLPDRAAALPRQRHQPRRAAHRRRGEPRRRRARRAQAEGRGASQARHRARLLRHRLGRLQR